MENRKESIYEKLARMINESDLADDKKTEALARLLKVREKPVRILLVGPTAAGKSSTINALFDMDKAVVGSGVEPETKEISRYTIENLTIYDAPGLGDGISEDKKYQGMIRSKLMELDKNGDPVIDLVLVVCDASQKDLGTVYDCINNVLVPVLGRDAEHRILIGLNKSDLAMSGRHWNEVLNCPDEVLEEYLEKKADSIQRRISESTGITFHPVYYAAGYKENGCEQKPYNIIKLLSVIVAAVPKEKRLSIADNLNPDPKMWEFSDGKQNYKSRTLADFWDSVKFLLSSMGMSIKNAAGSIGKAFKVFFMNFKD